MQNANPSLGKNSIFATHTAHVADNSVKTSLEEVFVDIDDVFFFVKNKDPSAIVVKFYFV